MILCSVIVLRPDGDDLPRLQAALRAVVVDIDDVDVDGGGGSHHRTPRVGSGHHQHVKLSLLTV